MPAKQKTKRPSKEVQELSDSSEVSDSDYEAPRVSTRSSKRLSAKDIKQMTESLKKKSKSVVKKSKERKFISLNEEAKISASNAKLLSYIVGGKNPISRTEMTARAKKFLVESEEFDYMKITVAAINSISIVMNHRFGALFNIASILAAYRDVQTVTALDLDLAKAILDGELSSVNANPNKHIGKINEYRNKSTINGISIKFADKLVAAMETVTENDSPTQNEIRDIFNDEETRTKIEKELRKYLTPIKNN